MVETDLVERVFESKNTLDFMRFDQGLEDILDCGDRLAGRTVCSGKPVSDSEDTAEVV